MKQGWEIKKLGEVCEILNGGTPDTKIAQYWNGDNLWITPKDMGQLNSIFVDNTSRKITNEGIKNSSAKILPPNSIILSSRAPIGHLAINTKPISTNQGCKGLIPNKNINTLYLYYFLSKSVDLLNSLGSGTTFKELSGTKLGSVDIPIPPLPEQEKIVSILDKAFSAIDQAKQNAEKNLKNAKELFDSYLNNIDADKIELNDLVNITTGKLNSNEAVEDGLYPFFTCSREIFSINHYAFDLEAILLAGNNASGDFNVKHYKGKFNAYQRTYVITINNTNKIMYRYLYFQLLKSLKEFKDKSVGANTKFLKIGMIQSLKIPVPEISKQECILNILDDLFTKTKQLEEIYQQKLIELDDLKKSILQKAFNGELI